jgi:hypothetical protein
MPVLKTVEVGVVRRDLTRGSDPWNVVRLRQPEQVRWRWVIPITHRYEVLRRTGAAMESKPSSCAAQDGAK